MTPIQQQLVNLNAALLDQPTPHAIHQKGQRVWLVDRSGRLVRSFYLPAERLPLYYEMPEMPPFPMNSFAATSKASDLAFRTRTFVRRWIEVSPTVLASKDFVWPYEWPYDEPIYFERER